MKIKVANPIYDSVFKYLLEDERVARTLLSALLKREVESVKPRRNEYSNIRRYDISMFRIDFAARVLQPDGTTQLVLIELQKTWLPTETLRFRQYLGAQYQNQENMLREPEAHYGMPMVAVYLLGHRVGDIEEPVLYVRHKAYDYDDREVTHGLPNPFVESLTHDSIIVQIPLLHGRIKNHLDKVLSVFDQTQIDGNDAHTLLIDESRYNDDADMQRILHRLTMAVAEPQVRQDMNVEDEFYQAIEERDTALMQAKKDLEKQRQRLAQKDEALARQDEALAQKDEALARQDEALARQDEALAQKDEMLKTLIQDMLQSGSSAADIARLTGRTPEEIERMR